MQLWDDMGTSHVSLSLGFMFNLKIERIKLEKLPKN
jgi:hypothetical protein